MELIKLTDQLTPAGNPDFKMVAAMPPIKDIVSQDGPEAMLFVLSAIIRNFCASVNVVRNMSTGQILMAANTLLQECKNYRVEDFVLMFDMAMKGKIKPNDGRGIMDRLDLTVIVDIWNIYDGIRYASAEQIQEEQVAADEKFLDEINPEKFVGPEAWTELLKKVKANYNEGRTGYRPTEQEKLEAKENRINDMRRRFFGNYDQ